MRLGSDGRLLGSPFAFGAAECSLEEFLVKLGCSERLRQILTVHGFWAGVSMDRCPAYLVLATLASLLQSAWELGCSGAAMADLLAEQARYQGVEIVYGEAAREVLVDQGRVVGVRLDSGRTCTCDKMVAAIHPKLLLEMLPADALPGDYRRGLTALPETSAAVMVHTLLSGRLHRPPGFHIFRVRRAREMHVDGLFLLLKPGPRPEQSHLTLIGGSSYHAWEKWSTSRSGKRGPEYLAAKEEVAERLLHEAATVLGPLGEIIPVDIATPLTLRDWAASPQGALYGLQRAIPMDLRYAVLTRIPLRSLILVGQNAIAPGLLGVSLGVLRGVGEVVGRGQFRAFLEKNLKGES